MITIIDTVTTSKQVVKPTIFPDGTSQVWKIDLNTYWAHDLKIVWNFEKEEELIWINQLLVLLYQSGLKITELYIPYLPYGRQDKAVSNESTFALLVFKELLLTSHVQNKNVTTLDAHSDVSMFPSYYPREYINKAIEEFEPTHIVFPDAGAKERYAYMMDFEQDILVLDKVRDQLTGNITGLTFKDEYILKDNSRFLIVDDICDGGKTFTEASMLLHSKTICEVGLYVTHGIFSKGFEVLIKSGIKAIYTTNSLPRNTVAYDCLLPLDNKNDYIAYINV